MIRHTSSRLSEPDLETRESEIAEPIHHMSSCPYRGNQLTGSGTWRESMVARYAVACAAEPRLLAQGGLEK